MYYLNKIEDDWRADKIPNEKYLELKRAYDNATPEEKKDMDDKYPNPKANGSNSKTSEQKTLEAIRSNTSTMVNIMVFYLVVFLIYIIWSFILFR